MKVSGAPGVLLQALPGCLTRSHSNLINAVRTRTQKPNHKAAPAAQRSAKLPHPNPHMNKAGASIPVICAHVCREAGYPTKLGGAWAFFEITFFQETSSDCPNRTNKQKNAPLAALILGDLTGKIELAMTINDLVRLRPFQGRFDPFPLFPARK